MNRYNVITLAVVTTLLTFCCCTTKGAKLAREQVSENIETVIPPTKPEETFPMPPIPTMITSPEDIIMYLSEHFWDLYDFSDTTLIEKAYITEQGLVDYIYILKEVPFAMKEKSIKDMLDKAKPHLSMYNHFVTLFEKYLYEPNSPFRDEELYIPVLNHIEQANLLPQAKQEIFKFQKKMAMKNRVGTTATNFEYTLANGEKKMMHNLQSNYLIVFFTNPDCHSCAATTASLVNSIVLDRVFALNSSNNKMLTVLSIYPDGDIDKWREALPSQPTKHWINSYDANEVIYNSLLYDIKATPTLYLLDKEKKVILKDTTLEAIEEFFKNKE